MVSASSYYATGPEFDTEQGISILHDKIDKLSAKHALELYTGGPALH